jgi:hypothetical protein
VAGGGAIFVLARFLIEQTLSDADKYASAISVVLAALSLLATVVVGLLRPAAAHPVGSSTSVLAVPSPRAPEPDQVASFTV